MTKLGLANFKIGISLKGDDRKNMVIRNRLITDNKKRGSDFKVDDVIAGKEIKRRRRMEYRGERVMPAPGGWDRETKPKTHESWRRERDCQDMKKTPPLHKKEKESCRRSDHSSSSSSSSSTVTIDEGSTTTTTTTSLSLTVAAQLSPTKALRAAHMKKRYAHLIFKANQALMHHQLQDQERERLQKQKIAVEKARIEEEIKAAQTLLRIRAESDLKIQRQREREAARIALEKMEKTVEFNDAWQIMRDFETLLNAV